jgi:hypothetical protein
MNDPIILTDPRRPIQCYVCGIRKDLLVEEKIDTQTGKIIEKNFICLEHAGYG